MLRVDRLNRLANASIDRLNRPANASVDRLNQPANASGDRLNQPANAGVDSLNQPANASVDRLNQPANAGGGVKPGVERSVSGAEPQECERAYLSSPRMRATAFTQSNDALPPASQARRISLRTPGVPRCALHPR